MKFTVPAFQGKGVDADLSTANPDPFDVFHWRRKPQTARLDDRGRRRSRAHVDSSDHIRHRPAITLQRAGRELDFFEGGDGGGKQRKK